MAPLACGGKFGVSICTTATTASTGRQRKNRRRLRLIDPNAWGGPTTQAGDIRQRLPHRRQRPVLGHPL